MPWVKRDEAGNIIEAYGLQQDGATEELLENNPEVIAFRNRVLVVDSE